METLKVNAEALRQILQALNGPPHYIRELQAIRDLPGRECPITRLTDEYNKAVLAHNEP